MLGAVKSNHCFKFIFIRCNSWILQVQLEQERQIGKHVRTAREKLLNECRLLHNRLLECNVNLSSDDDESLIKDSSLVEDALDLLTKSDDKISFLLSEVHLDFWLFSTVLNSCPLS